MSETTENTDTPTVSSSGSCVQAEPMPWTITAPPLTGEVVDASNAAVWGGDGDLVAEVHSNPAYGVPALDRAKLLAASPDLLDAALKAERVLTSLQERHLPAPEDVWDAVTSLRQALASARGRV
jgi:hypothetical protein